MTLIKSISGIRGTIGGAVGENLTPVDAVKFASAYGTFLKTRHAGKGNERLKVVIGKIGALESSDLKTIPLVSEAKR